MAIFQHDNSLANVAVRINKRVIILLAFHKHHGMNIYKERLGLGNVRKKKQFTLLQKPQKVPEYLQKKVVELG